MSCIAENAADAFDESFPQTDFTPLFPKRSAFGMERAAGGVENVVPSEDDCPGLRERGEEYMGPRGSIFCSKEDPVGDPRSPRELA